MSRLNVRIAAVTALVASLAASVPAASRSPFAFLAPTVTMDTATWETLAAGSPVVRVLPARGREIAVFAAVRVDADGDRLAAWTRDIARLHAGRLVPQIARFASPPRLEDVAAASLEEADLEDLRQCRPGDCGVKLSAREIVELQGRTTRGGDWKRQVQDSFRQLLLQRARCYTARGDADAAPYHDDRDPVDPRPLFAALLARTAFLERGFPHALRYAARSSELPLLPVADSFLYWSKESLGARAIVSITHVTIVRGDGDAALPDTLVVSKQIFATHYKNAALMVTALISSPSGNYLVYYHRSNLDVLQGLWGGVIRRIIERRLRAEAPAVIQAIRARLESGDPPH